jgi:methylisocitrate lyase
MRRALQRAEAYVKAGADMLFPEALTELSHYEQFAKRFPDIPILANITGTLESISFIFIFKFVYYF